MTGINLLRLYKTFLNGYETPFRNAIASFDPDIIHLNDCHLIKPLKLVKKLGKKVIVHARFNLSIAPTWAWSYQTGNLRRFADKIIAIDQSVLRTLGDQPNATVVYNPLNPTTQKDAHMARAISGTLFSKENPMKIGFVSLFLPSKGIFELLEAARILRGHEDILFLFVGSNGRADSFYRSFFGKTCDLLGLAPDSEKRMRAFVAKWKLENVQFLGFVEDVSAIMRTLDILAFPSWLDGSARSVFEAGLFGVPSIISMEHKIEDIIHDGKNGIIIPEKDPLSLSRTILKLYNDPSLLHSLGERARGDFSAQFNNVVVAKSVLAVYEEILETTTAKLD